MANNVKFLSGTYAQYVSLTQKSDDTLYFVDGQLFKGAVSYSDQIAVVSALPDTLVAGKVYVNTIDKSVTYYDGTTSTVVVPATVGSIGDATPDTDLANVKAIKDFVAAEIAKISANYTVTLTDEVTGTGEKTKQTLKQGTGDKEKTIGSIVVPDLVMEVKGTPNDGYLKTYQFTYGTGSTFEIDIPKDLVVKSGDVIVVDDTHPISGLTNGTYLKLVIANDDANPVYINTNSLVDIYTGKTATVGASVVVSDTNEISVTLSGAYVGTDNITDKAITKGKLEQDVQDSLSAMSWGVIS